MYLTPRCRGDLPGSRVKRSTAGVRPFVIVGRIGVNDLNGRVEIPRLIHIKFVGQADTGDLGPELDARLQPEVTVNTGGAHILGIAAAGKAVGGLIDHHPVIGVAVGAAVGHQGRRVFRIRPVAGAIRIVRIPHGDGGGVQPAGFQGNIDRFRPG